MRAARKSPASNALENGAALAVCLLLRDHARAHRLRSGRLDDGLVKVFAEVRLLRVGTTEPESIGNRQTYIGLVCGPDDTLHLVFRMWRSGTEPFPHSSHATLAYQRKRPGKGWEEPRVLVVAPFSEYSIFYHRLSIDRAGRLFLSYDYWSTFWFYRTDHRGRRRALMMSPDGGDEWKLVASEDFEQAR